MSLWGFIELPGWREFRRAETNKLVTISAVALNDPIDAVEVIVLLDGEDKNRCQLGSNNGPQQIEEEPQ